MKIVPKRQRTTTNPDFASPCKLGGLGPVTLAKRVWRVTDHGGRGPDQLGHCPCIILRQTRGPGRDTSTLEPRVRAVMEHRAMAQRSVFCSPVLRYDLLLRAWSRAREIVLDHSRQGDRR